MASVRVLEEMPELGAGLNGDALAAARRVPAPVVRVPEGPVGFDAELGAAVGSLGLLVLGGLLLRRLEVLGTVVCTELLGPGDLLRPWTQDDGSASVPAEAHWECILDGQLAVLDGRFASEAARWPSVAAALIEKAVQRSRSMHFQLAVCHLTRIEERLLITFWHLADRFGRMTAQGVTLPLPLPHRTLASIVGARRPSVTSALTALREEGTVERTEDGWLLRGQAPEQLGRLRRDSALPPPRSLSD